MALGAVATHRATPRPVSPGPLGVPPAPAGRIPRLGGRPIAALLPLIVVGLVLFWWGWKSGAYFRVTFLPGSIVLLALTIALLLYAPWPARLRGGARVAVWALAGLAMWTLLSALWSPTPDVAVEDATRVGVYALAFVLGAWLCLLLGRRMLLSLAPLAGACAAVGLLTLIMLWTGDDAAELLEADATLRYPLGYRNAVAAFFLAGCFPILALASSSQIDWRLRGALLGSATLALELAVLSQSRAAVFAAVFAVSVFVATHPSRLRALAWLLLAALPAAAALPWLLDVFQGGEGNTSASLPLLDTACAAIAVTSGLAVLLGCVAARREPQLALSPWARRRVGGALLGALGVLLLVGVISLARTEGGPIGFLERNADELTAGSPDLSSSGSRFGLDVRSERGDLWRVAVDDFTNSPLAGEGAGGWRFSYLLDRDSNLQPEDPHSVEVLMASELGLPGLLLFGAFVLGAILAVLRARRLGPTAAALAAAALGMAAYWLLHASVEWFWSYPALTLPVVFALGAAAAPALLRLGTALNRDLSRALIAAAALAALVMVPFLLSERYTNDALRSWQADLSRAYSDLGRAADLNPFGDRPLVAEAVIAEEAGEPQRALAALSEAQSRAPDEWTLYFLEARVLAGTDPAGADRALARARELNPTGAEIAALEEELQQGPP